MSPSLHVRLTRRGPASRASGLRIMRCRRSFTWWTLNVIGPIPGAWPPRSHLQWGLVLPTSLASLSGSWTWIGQKDCLTPFITSIICSRTLGIHCQDSPAIEICDNHIRPIMQTPFPQGDVTQLRKPRRHRTGADRLVAARALFQDASTASPAAAWAADSYV